MPLGESQVDLVARKKDQARALAARPRLSNVTRRGFTKNREKPQGMEASILNPQPATFKMKLNATIAVFRDTTASYGKFHERPVRFSLFGV